MLSSAVEMISCAETASSVCTADSIAAEVCDVFPEGELQAERTSAEASRKYRPAVVFFMESPLRHLQGAT